MNPILDPLPIEANLELLLGFARRPVELAGYEAHARSLGLKVVEEDHMPEAKLFHRSGFALAIDASRELAGVQIAGLFEDDGKLGVEPRLGILASDHMDVLQAAFARVRSALCALLGAPAREGTWEAKSLFDTQVYSFGYCAWRVGPNLLALLHEDDGDRHVGEFATVMLKIASRSREDGLPDSMGGLILWPTLG